MRLRRSGVRGMWWIGDFPLGIERSRDGWTLQRDISALSSCRDAMQRWQERHGLTSVLFESRAAALRCVQAIHGIDPMPGEICEPPLRKTQTGWRSADRRYVIVAQAGLWGSWRWTITDIRTGRDLGGATTLWSARMRVASDRATAC